ncbi:hypothetical protein EYF80_018576 [Liparis tanakae]|uniref:Uncharacterized protein n=1 Tax=Liparis tanakae TaxID=230148 RepID=A0A4Z2HZX7_9TELE|nr:hypothetical protein EYF80_018576 [Liparis tanakae]
MFCSSFLHKVKGGLIHLSAACTRAPTEAEWIHVVTSLLVPDRGERRGEERGERREERRGEEIGERVDRALLVKRDLLLSARPQKRERCFSATHITDV